MPAIALTVDPYRANCLLATHKACLTKIPPKLWQTITIGLLAVYGRASESMSTARTEQYRPLHLPDPGLFVLACHSIVGEGRNRAPESTPMRA